MFAAAEPHLAPRSPPSFLRGDRNEWREHDGRGEGGKCWLEKENEAFPSERLEPGGAWKVWGTVTRIVDTPVRPRRPRRT